MTSYRPPPNRWAKHRASRTATERRETLRLIERGHERSYLADLDRRFREHEESEKQESWERYLEEMGVEVGTLFRQRWLLGVSEEGWKVMGHTDGELIS